MRGDRDLARVLEDYFGEWSQRTGIAVDVWALPSRDVPVRVPQAVARNVFHAIREAFANVERHSHARTVSVALTVGRAGLRLTVSDDGTGFPPGTSGHGLVAMRASFAEVGGTLTINSVPGEGTTISGVVPPEALRAV
ncbi:MAG TPA: ATP-binding protein [Thermopolyspora sp.]|jgi:Signal transduction histidine kinase